MIRNLILTALTFSLISFLPDPARAEAPAKKLRIAAAADLRYALQDIAQNFEKSHPGLKLDVVYGSSGQFTQQILAGADFDVFLSADSSYPQMLKTKNKVAGDDFQYGSGRLVLWTSNGSGVKLDESAGLKNILQPSVKKIAIANPDHAPYGKVAEAVLKKDGLYDQVKSKLVFASNIAEAAQFAQSKAAQVGLIASALAISPEMKKEGSFVLLKDAESLRQSGVILSASRNIKDARVFRDYLMGSDGQAILISFGFKKE